MERSDPRAEGRPASLQLRGGVLERIRQHAERGYPEEVCGGLLGRREAGGRVVVQDLTELENQRTDERTRRYLIGPEDVAELERTAAAKGLTVVGYYHSHPDAAAIPSDFDREHAWPWYIYLIVSVRSGQLRDARAWQLKDDRSAFEPVAKTIGNEARST